MKHENKGNSITLTCTREELTLIQNTLHKASTKLLLEGATEKADILDTFCGDLSSIQCKMYTTIKFNVVY